MSSPPNLRLVIGGLSLGTMLNPLNSTMITVALVAIARDLDATFVEVSWIITVFYLVSCTAQPVLGRFADRFGPKRIFVSGMVVVLVAAVWGSLARDIVNLSAARGLLALGTACAYPSAVNLLGRWVRPGPASVRALGGIQVMNFLGMALGPAAGGLVLAAVDWSAQFWINVPLALIALVVVAVWAPADSHRGIAEAPADSRAAQAADSRGPGRRHTFAGVFFAADVPGILAFTCAMSAIILALLDSLPGLRWALVALSLAAGLLFIWWELRAPVPFLDLRSLRRNPTLLRVLLQFAVFNVVFYLVLFAFPQFLEVIEGVPVVRVGLYMALLAVVSAITVLPAARLIQRWGLTPVLVVATAILAAALIMMWLIGTESTWWSTIAVLVLFGVPYGLIPLALNQAMFASARTGAVGVAAGLFQLSRYMGAVIAIVIMAVIVGELMTPGAWKAIVGAMAVVSALGGGLVLVGRPPRLAR